MKLAPLMTRKTFVNDAIAGGVAGAGAVLVAYVLTLATNSGNGFTALSGLGDSLVGAALISFGVLPFAAVLAYISLKLSKQKRTASTAVLVGAGVYAVFALLRAAGADMLLLVAFTGLLSAFWGAGAGMVIRSAPSRLVAWGVAAIATIVSFGLIGFVAEPIAKAAEKRMASEAQTARHNKITHFTIYAAPNRVGGVYLTRGDGGIEFTANQFVQVRESAVKEEDAAIMSPPYHCDVMQMSQLLQGMAIDLVLKTGDAMPKCHKIGLTKDNKPVYQQFPENTGGVFYYYTRIQNTNIILEAPIDHVTDPNVDVNAEIVAIVDSLQPFDAGKVEPAR